MVRINKVYTKAGDAGETQLVGGDKVPKNHARIECYGTIDELNSFLGVFLSKLKGTPAAPALRPAVARIQNELFNVGTQLATPDGERRAKYPNIRDENIAALEADIDSWNAELPELTSFVLPGGTASAAAAHVARTVCRRAERLVVALASQEEVDGRHLRYLNRLSDALFVMARFCVLKEEVEERLWKPEDV